MTQRDLPLGVRDYLDVLVEPYFLAIAEWYEAVGIGVRGGELNAIIQRRLGDPFFGIGLNPGHLIHLDEWLHSPIFAGSDIPLRSGMAIQVDVIPATHSPYHTTNIEDGIALADADLRSRIRAKISLRPGRASKNRRDFMRDALGIQAPAGSPALFQHSRVPATLLAIARHCHAFASRGIRQ